MWTKENTGLLLWFLIVIASILSLEAGKPPASAPLHTEATLFSAERAAEHVAVIARAPHPAGTGAHAAICNYLERVCRQMGLQVTTQDTIAVRSFWGGAIAGRTRNVIARLPGTNPAKTILVMAHYDSQPNTPGAGDDGAGVAAMLETIRALRANDPLRNDVIFLFTDQEEVGMLGAEAFARFYPDFEDIAVVLNFEARGNRGTSMIAEVNPENGWIIRRFAEAAPHPVASAITYEVYRRMPNDSDFSIFRNRGKAGLNTAFIDGFVHYHSMTDTPDRLSRRSLQHHGDNMLALVRHLGNLDLSNPKAPDLIFFNPFGHLLLLYPATWDGPLLWGMAGLFLLLVVVGWRRGRLRPLTILAGTGLFLLALVLSLGAGWLLTMGIRSLYPFYGNFYAFNFYNSHWYLLSIVALTMLVFSLLYGLALRRMPADPLMTGAVLFMVLLAVVLKQYLDTGAYLLYYPLAIFIILQILFWRIASRPRIKPGTFAAGQLAGLMPALGLWVPFLYNIYVVFSLGMPLGTVGMTALLLGLMIPAIDMLRAFAKWALPGMAGLVLLTSLLIAHFTAFPTAVKPLQTELMYALDKEAGGARWISGDVWLPDWSQQLLDHPEEKTPVDFFPTGTWTAWSCPTPVVDFPSSAMKIIRDTVVDGQRRVQLRLWPADSVSSFSLYYEVPNIELLQVGKQPVNARPPAAQGFKQLAFYAPPPEGVELHLRSLGSGPVELILIDRYLGLPPSVLPSPWPADLIPGPGYRSNTVQVKRRVRVPAGE
jgi:hypothetical protein